MTHDNDLNAAIQKAIARGREEIERMAYEIRQRKQAQEEPAKNPPPPPDLIKLLKQRAAEAEIQGSESIDVPDDEPPKAA
jgi:hypothetical protein